MIAKLPFIGFTRMSTRQIAWFFVLGWRCCITQ